MELIQLCFSCFLLFLALGAAGSFLIFAVDVIKWHKREERVKVTGSAQKLPDIYRTEESEVKSDGQSKRSDNGDRGSDPDSASAHADQPRQPDASALFDTWL